MKQKAIFTGYTKISSYRMFSEFKRGCLRCDTGIWEYTDFKEGKREL